MAADVNPDFHGNAWLTTSNWKCFWDPHPKLHRPPPSFNCALLNFVLAAPLGLRG
jgi:hypothetical protein